MTRQRPRCADCGQPLGRVDIDAGTGLCGWCELDRTDNESEDA